LLSRVPLTDCVEVAALTLLLLKVTARAPLLSRVPLTDCVEVAALAFSLSMVTALGLVLKYLSQKQQLKRFRV
jgi:hypothetical protein